MARRSPECRQPNKLPCFNVVRHKVNIVGVFALIFPSKERDYLREALALAQCGDGFFINCAFNAHQRYLCHV